MKKQLSVYRQSLGLLREYPIFLVCVIVGTFLFTLIDGLSLGLVLPFLHGSTIETDWAEWLPPLDNATQFLGRQSVENRIRLAAVALIVIMAIHSLLASGIQILSLLLRLRVEKKLMTKAFQQVLTVQLSYIQAKQQGHLHEKLFSHMRDTIKLTDHVLQSINLLCIIGLYALFTIFISWQLTIVASLLLLLMAIAIRAPLSIRIRKRARQTRTSGMTLRADMVDTISGLMLVHLFGAKKAVRERFRRGQQRYLEDQKATGMLVACTRPLFDLSGALLLALILIGATYLLPSQTDAWLGQLVLFVLVLMRLMGPVSKLGQIQATINQLEPAFESAMDFLRRDDKPYLTNGTAQIDSLAQGVALNNVSFRYAPTEPLVLEDVTIAIPQGQMTAIVGPSGAGKSTLVHLIARLYDPVAGHIAIDDIELPNLMLNSWRSQIAVVNQDTFLFHDTVMTNLCFGNAQATPEEVIQAAKLAKAHNFIEKLPQGYDTVLGDRGIRLSGGQRQRIAIARALLIKPQILILDEATSELDTETELAIQQALDTHCQGWTILAIAHRLSTIRRAKNIVVLEQGRVIAQGTHEALMDRHGLYRQLVQAQNIGSTSPNGIYEDVAAQSPLVSRPEDTRPNTALGLLNRRGD